MSRKRRTFSAEFKAQVGLEALKGIEPASAIAAKHDVHPLQVGQWKKEVVEKLPEVFAQKPAHDAQAAAEKEKQLYEEIGRLRMELEWLKKKVGPLGG